MDLNRIGDQNYMAELKTAYLAQESDMQYVSERVAVLKKLADKWGAGDSPQPPEFDDAGISANEFVAIALAVHREYQFGQPTAQFLMLRPWQQAWVLQMWKLEKYIGCRIGVS